MSNETECVGQIVCIVPKTDPEQFFREVEGRTVTLENGMMFSIENDGYESENPANQIANVNLIDPATNKAEIILSVHVQTEEMILIHVHHTDRNGIEIDAIRAFKEMVPCTFHDDGSEIVYELNGWTVGGLKVINGKLLRVVQRFETVAMKFPTTRPEQPGINGDVSLERSVLEKVARVTIDIKTPDFWVDTPYCALLLVDGKACGRVYSERSDDESVMRVRIDDYQNLVLICDVARKFTLSSFPASFDPLSDFDVAALAEQRSTITYWKSFSTPFPNSIHIVYLGSLVKIALDPYNGEINQVSSRSF